MFKCNVMKSIQVNVSYSEWHETRRYFITIAFQLSIMHPFLSNLPQSGLMTQGTVPLGHILWGITSHRIPTLQQLYSWGHVTMLNCIWGKHLHHYTKENYELWIYVKHCGLLGYETIYLVLWVVLNVLEECIISIIRITLTTQHLKDSFSAARILYLILIH